MVKGDTAEQAAVLYKTELERTFGAMYSDIDPLSHLQQELSDHGPLIPSSKVNKNNEVVTAAPRANLSLAPLDEPEQRIYSSEQSKLILEQLSEELVSARRGDCEKDTSLKQIIPYVMLKHKDDYFAYKRLSGSGEKRLVDSISIGVGGHMNYRSDDRDHAGLLEVIAQESLRELNEELIIGQDVKVDIKWDDMKILNDDKEDVGKVHIGVILFAELSSDDVQVRETDSLEGSFVSKEWLSENRDKLESWSRMYIDSLDLAETSV
ncbi:hypothetical protein C0431_12845 [bacterium]|nr:hypothetical protein [bacterium]